MSYAAFAEHYDLLTGNIDYDAIAHYYDSLCSRFGGKKGILLDLACGTGSLSVKLSQLGYDVIGADASPEMLSVAVSKEHRGIEYLCQDMTKLDLYGTIDCTVCSLDSINHLKSLDELRQTFAGVSLFSNPGALFMFDVNTQYKHENILSDNTFVYETEDIFCVWENESLGEGTVLITLDFFTLDKKTGLYARTGDEFTETAFAREDIERLLKETGFSVCACYEYPTFQPPNEKSEKLTFTARKE